ncbi:MAG: hypothetical protein HY821_01420 [Acidobacteria bacterium]|nr:hypothetical protein [Acidobacteriota bacterium]
MTTLEAIILGAAQQQAAGGQLRPEDITDPSQLPAGVTVTADSSRTLSFTSPTPFGFDFRWLREAACSVLRGTTGIRIDSEAQANVSASLSTRYSATVTRDEIDGQPALRLQLSTASSNSLEAQATITAQAAIQPPSGAADPLFQAILGIHPLQWLRDVMKDIGSSRFTRIAGNCGATVGSFDQLIQHWRTIGARAESALWSSLSSTTAWQQLRQWTAWLSSPAATPEALLQRINGALEADAAFAATPAARYLEAIAGTALTNLSSELHLEPLRAAAGQLEALAARPEVERLLLALPARAVRELSSPQPWPWAEERLRELFGEEDLAAFDRLAEPWRALSARAYQAAAQALSQKLSAELSLTLSRSAGRSILAEASFRFTSEGLALYRQVLSGDLTPLFQPSPQIKIFRGVLTHEVRRARHIEFELPFLDRREFQVKRQALAHAEVVPQPGGALVIRYAAEATDSISDSQRASTLIFSAAFSASDGETVRDNSSLTFSDTRTISAGDDNAAFFAVLDAYGVARPSLPAEPCRASLTLSIPGTFAEAWMNAPHSRDDQYIPTLCRVSRVIQAMGRRWLPALYLTSIDNYHTPSAVHPLLAWQCSQPYTLVRKRQFGYDVMDRDAVERAIYSSQNTLPAILRSIRDLLRAAGRPDQASYYEPNDMRYILANVLRQRRNFCALLAADNYLVEEVIRLLSYSRELRTLNSLKPDAAVRQLIRYSNALVDAFHRRFRRLYARQDFMAFGPLFLLEATAALNGHSDGNCRIEATLTIHTPQGERHYHNAAAMVHA